MALNECTAHELADLLQKGEVSSRDITEAVLRRIEAVEGHVRAFVTVCPEEALAAADEIDRRRSRGDPLHPMAGIPVAVKDNMCTRGLPTTCSSKILENFVPPYDATAVAKLRAAGAVIIGKTNMDEFAMGSSTENSGLHPTHNPWELGSVPGGSSGGSTAAVAADETIWATGSDTGGSIRQPASLCGISGLKPTYGRISRYGLVAFASSLDQIGTVTKDAADAALLLEILSGKDPMDSTSVDIEVPKYSEEIKKGADRLRLGLPKEYFVEGLDPEVESAVKKAAQVLEGLGATLVEVSLPHTKFAIPTYYVLCTAEASSNLARYDGVAYGLRVEGENIVDMYTNTRNRGFGDEVKRRIIMGTYVLSSGFYDAYYLKSQRVRTLIRGDFETAFQECDLVLTPTSPTPTWPIGAKAEDPLEMYLSDVFTTPSSLAGLPAMSIPCGFAGGRLPIGLHIIGKVFDEATVLRCAWAFQQATDFHRRKPQLEEPA